jgi:hypothetical protein
VPKGLIDLFKEEGEELNNEDHWCRFKHSTTLKELLSTISGDLAGGGTEGVVVLAVYASWLEKIQEERPALVWDERTTIAQ